MSNMKWKPHPTESSMFNVAEEKIQTLHDIRIIKLDHDFLKYSSQVKAQTCAPKCYFCFLRAHCWHRSIRSENEFLLHWQATGKINVKLTDRSQVPNQQVRGILVSVDGSTKFRNAQQIVQIFLTLKSE